jgi:3-dehydroquinate synthase
MLAAAEISVARGLMPDGDRRALAQLIQQMGPLPAVGDLPAADVLAAIRRDKKVIHGTLHFVLPEKIGQATTVADVTVEEIESGLAAIGIVHESASAP